MQQKLSIGENIRCIRELKGYSQQGLADSIGVSQKTISRIENGLTSPSIEIIEKITTCFEIEFNKLIEADRSIIMNQFKDRDGEIPLKKVDSSEINRLYKDLLEEKERYIQLLEKELKWLRENVKK